MGGVSLHSNGFVDKPKLTGFTNEAEQATSSEQLLRTHPSCVIIRLHSAGDLGCDSAPSSGGSVQLHYGEPVNITSITTKRAKFCDTEEKAGTIPLFFVISLVGRKNCVTIFWIFKVFDGVLNRITTNNQVLVTKQKVVHWKFSSSGFYLNKTFHSSLMQLKASHSFNLLQEDSLGP